MFKIIGSSLLLSLPMSQFVHNFGVVEIDAILSAMSETNGNQPQLTETSNKHEDEFQ